MDADATVDVEYVDYDFDHHHHHHKKHHRAKKYSNYDDDDNECDDDDDDGGCHNHDDDDACNGDGDEEMRCREFDVSIVLRVNAKVMADREVMLNAGVLPVKPKG